MSDQPSEHPIFGKVISVYTRAQALADGVLIDAGSMTREAGFRWPVAITAGAWADCVAWDDADSERQTHQDQSGRLWDVLFMAAYAARANAARVARRRCAQTVGARLGAQHATTRPQ